MLEAQDPCEAMSRGTRNLDLSSSSFLYATYVILMKLKFSEIQCSYQQNGYNSTYLQVVVKIKSKAPSTMPDMFKASVGSLSSTLSDFQLGNGAGADIPDCSTSNIYVANDSFILFYY